MMFLSFAQCLSLGSVATIQAIGQAFYLKYSGGTYAFVCADANRDGSVNALVFRCTEDQRYRVLFLKDSDFRLMSGYKVRQFLVLAPYKYYVAYDGYAEVWLGRNDAIGGAICSVESNEVISGVFWIKVVLQDGSVGYILCERSGKYMFVKSPEDATEYLLMHSNQYGEGVLFTINTFLRNIDAAHLTGNLVDLEKLKLNC